MTNPKICFRTPGDEDPLSQVHQSFFEPWVGRTLFRAEKGMRGEVAVVPSVN